MSVGSPLPASVDTMDSHSLTFLVRVSMAVKQHHDRSDSDKGKHLIQLVCSFRGAVHYQHGGVRADMVLEK